jgi:cytochrome oxidase Cu insertion factor (SCO1/SenC/PrrC family)
MIDKRNIINSGNVIILVLLWFIFSTTLVFSMSLSNFDLALRLHLRGVFDSKVSLMPMPNALRPVAIAEVVKSGKETLLSIPGSLLPGEFVLRFESRENESSTPRPVEKQVILNSEDAELWINPLYANNPDSVRWNKGEKENTALYSFSVENTKRKQKIGLLQNFLMSYDDTQSHFFKLGVEEHEKRRGEYNRWLTEQVNLYSSLFVGHTFRFQYVPHVSFAGSPREKMQEVISNYFDGVDMNDTLIIYSKSMGDWMNGYVNIYGSQATTDVLRDSLFTLAGKRAIEKAKNGHPKVYGWMVDYFYKGYESFNIQKGISMLQQYIDDPNCMTTKRQQIIKRLDGMAKLTVGTQAPDFTLNYLDGSDFNFHGYKGTANYKLLLFWSADCSHCESFVKELKGWYNEPTNEDKLNIVAVSVDETDTEIKKWETAIISLQGWKHLRANGGINSTVANDYSILSTPVMFLVDSKSNKIIAFPDNLEQLKKALEKL